MAINRKLGRPSDQKLAILRSLSTALVINGRAAADILHGSYQVSPAISRFIAYYAHTYAQAL